MELTSELLNRKVGFYLWLPSLFNCLIKTLANHSNNFDLGINQLLKMVTLITYIIFCRGIHSLFLQLFLRLYSRLKIGLICLFISFKAFVILSKRMNSLINKIRKANPSKNIIICSVSLGRFKSLDF